MSSHPSFLAIGECMMELAEADGAYERAFAGDTYNCAVYVKRARPDTTVQMFSAVGDDPISKAMLEQWAANGVGQELTVVSPTAHPGIYAISTDDHGERTFTYWRDRSAAREMMQRITPDITARIEQSDWIYFSGITLAILTVADRNRLFQLLAAARANGAKLAFDPNYRPALWPDRASAVEWVTRAYQLVDVALPGLADHQALFDQQDQSAVLQFVQSQGPMEIVIKAEADGVTAYVGREDRFHQAVSLVPPVDTTGAGDAFAGTYLAERLWGARADQALAKATQTAGIVVQHRGAIVDEQAPT